MNICSVETSSDALNGSFALRIVITAAGCERGGGGSTYRRRDKQNSEYGA